MKKTLSLGCLIHVISIMAASAQVGIGTTTPEAQLEVTATNHGILIPRVALTSATDATSVVNPQGGQLPVSTLIYNIATAGPTSNRVTPGFYYWNDSRWWPVSDWGLRGNVGLNADDHFIGTLDDTDLVFKRRGIEAGRIGLRKTAFGASSMEFNIEGVYNTAFGYEALRSSSTPGANNTGSYNTAVGYQALHKNTSGQLNTANGMQALNSNRAGSGNTANGAHALVKNTEGQENTAVGNGALFSNTTGDNNTANGSGALYSNIVGNSNTANGINALYNNTTGSSNTANGSNALYNNTAGQWNTAVGIGALYYNIGTNANSNTAVGVDALRSNTSGAANTAIGRRAFYNGENYNNSTALGNDAMIGASNTVRIGNSSVTHIYAQVGITATSDKRFKKDIQENVPGLAFITKLNPVTYRFDARKQEALTNKNKDYNSTEDNYPEKYDIEKITFSGFLAQDVEEAAKSIGYDFSGVDIPKNEDGYYGLRYSEFVVPLVKAVQEQQQMIEMLQLKIEELTATYGLTAKKEGADVEE